MIQAGLEVQSQARDSSPQDTGLQPACVPSPELEAGAIMVQKRPQLWARSSLEEGGLWGLGALCVGTPQWSGTRDLLLSAPCGVCQWRAVLSHPRPLPSPQPE